jgi:hypothetical protein
LNSPSLRRALLPLAAVLALCAAAGDAHAQASGSIVVGATILPVAPRGLSGPLRIQLGSRGNDLAIRGEPATGGRPTLIFVRVSRPDSVDRPRRFVGQSLVAGAEVRMLLPDSRYPSGVQLERLILPGT